VIKEMPYVEKKIKRKYYAVPWCDDCDIKLQDSGMVLCTYPPQYKYYCPVCNKIYSFFKEEIGLKIEYEEN
jgi:hypothetical protein